MRYKGSLLLVHALNAGKSVLNRQAQQKEHVVSDQPPARPHFNRQNAVATTRLAIAARGGLVVKTIGIAIREVAANG